MFLYEQLGVETVWSSEKSAEDTVVTLIAQTDGNLVLYKGPSSSGNALWTSDTIGRCRVDGKIL